MRRIFLALLINLIMFLNAGGREAQHVRISPYYATKDTPLENKLIAHAAGCIDGAVYTNSKEALNSSIKAGFKFIEIDLRLSQDGYLVALHDWRSFHRRTGGLGDAPTVRSEFLKRRIDGKFTPMDEDYIAKVFSKHPDLILVTDKIRDLERVAKVFAPFKERIICEVFTLEDYRKALDLGLRPALWIRDISKLKSLALTEGLSMITAHLPDIYANRGVYEELYKEGVTILAFVAEDMDLELAAPKGPVSLFYIDEKP